MDTHTPTIVESTPNQLSVGLRVDDDQLAIGRDLFEYAIQRKP